MSSASVKVARDHGDTTTPHSNTNITAPVHGINNDDDDDFTYEEVVEEVEVEEGDPTSAEEMLSDDSDDDDDNDADNGLANNGTYAVLRLPVFDHCADTFFGQQQSDRSGSGTQRKKNNHNIRIFREFIPTSRDSGNGGPSAGVVATAGSTDTKKLPETTTNARTGASKRSRDGTTAKTTTAHTQDTEHLLPTAHNRPNEPLKIVLNDTLILTGTLDYFAGTAVAAHISNDVEESSKSRRREERRQEKEKKKREQQHAAPSIFTKFQAADTAHTDDDDDDDDVSEAAEEEEGKKSIVGSGGVKEEEGGDGEGDGGEHKDGKKATTKTSSSGGNSSTSSRKKTNKNRYKELSSVIIPQHLITCRVDGHSTVEYMTQMAPGSLRSL